jgi:outer membrane lipoprotein-sorting protein
MKRRLFMLSVLAAIATPASSLEDPVAQSRATYAALRSYADTGVVLDQSAPGAANVYRHKFKTYYRAPRNFYFEFQSDARAGGQRIVIWCDGGDFQSWFSATGQHASYPRGSNTAVLPFQQAAATTRGAVALIPGLIFSGSGLMGTFNEFGDAAEAGTEQVTGRKARKLIGIARSMYQQTQRETNVRRTTVWLDAENLLLRKVFEDTPKGLAASAVIQITVLLEPQANPTLNDRVFTFTVPSQQQ